MKTYKARWATTQDIKPVHDVFYQASGNLGGPVPMDQIQRFLKSTRILFAVMENPEGKVVGASVSRFPTDGVCYHMLFAVDKSTRGQGIGSGLIISILQMLKLEKFKNGIVNPFKAHKFFASYPDYNRDVNKLYEDLGFQHEGVLRMHTKAQTDLIIKAFYLLDGKSCWATTLPAFKHSWDKKAPRVDPEGLFTGPPPTRIVEVGLGLIEDTVSQGRDGGLW